MARLPRRLYVSSLSLAAALLATAPASGTTLRSLNLEGLVSRADKVFRGKVLTARAGSVEVGGGSLPIVTYRVQVDESFKGSYESIKGLRVAEIKMLGRTEPIRHGNYQRYPLLRDLPTLKVGETYLLMTTRPGRVGLSTTVGLGQGAFVITGKGADEQAVNAYHNANLGGREDLAAPAAQRSFRAAAPPAGRGPIAYAELADRIRAIVGGN
jgi:hypothetical protein